MQSPRAALDAPRDPLLLPAGDRLAQSRSWDAPDKRRKSDMNPECDAHDEQDDAEAEEAVDGDGADCNQGNHKQRSSQRPASSVLRVAVPEPSPSPSPPSSSSRMKASARASRARLLVESAQSYVMQSGYLRMRESAREWRMKTWYCALFRAELYWYATKRDATHARNLQGRVSLAGARPSDGLGKLHIYAHAFTFETTQGAVFLCAAPSAAERELWLERINTAAAASASSPHNSEGSELRSTESSDSVGATGSIGEDDARGASFAAVAAASASSSTAQSTRSERWRALHAKRSKSSLSSSSSSSVFASQASSCFACGIQFGLLRHHRRQCQSCGFAFCRLHCSKYAVGVLADGAESSLSLSSSASASASPSTAAPNAPQRCRVCDACSHRQHFVTFVVTFTARAIRLLRLNSINVAGLMPASASLAEPDTMTLRARAKMHRELAIVVANPASFTVLNVLCLLLKYADSPWMFTRALCMLVPLYERDPAAVEEYWVQFLGVFVPLLRTKEPFAPSMQFFLRFIFAVCRRSNAFALRTMWECLAFYEDARLRDDTLTMSYLMLLIYSSAAFDGDSAFVADKLFANAPPQQVDAILAVMKEFLAVRSVLREEIPKSLVARWFNAFCPHDMEATAHLVAQAAEIEDVDALLELFDPSATSYVEILHRHHVRIPSTTHASVDCDRPDEDDAFMIAKEEAFDAQASFVEQLTTIAETLRHVTPVQSRADALRELLFDLQEAHINTDAASSSSSQQEQEAPPLLHAPLTNAASEKAHTLKIVRVLQDEGKVFSTRSRAPTMMVFEACTADPREIQSIWNGGDHTNAVGADAADATDSQRQRLLQHYDSMDRVSRLSSRSQLARRDSYMLDVMLCGLDDDDASSTNGGGSVDERGSPHTSSNNSRASEDTSPPDELLVEEARDTYEDSMASFRGGLAALGPNSSRQRAQWERKIRTKSEFGRLRGWCLVSVIAKSHDDLRQEVFAMQLMRNVLDIFQGNELYRLYLRPYQILCTGANVGLIETLTDALSIDAVKKQYGSLSQYFAALFGASTLSNMFLEAQDAFITSVAASSLYCYLFQIKDRHNGNIMIDQQGHILHIDFGFMMGIAPGGAFSLEDAPFKLTREMVDLMGGHASSGFQEFAGLFVEGFMAVRREYIKLVTLIHLTAQDSPFPCFQYQTPHHVLHSFRQRLFLHDGDESARGRARRLIDKSYNHWGTRQYDKFQLATNGILP